MLSSSKNSFLLLEILISFLLLSMALPFIYPALHARSQQIKKWKTLRTLQEDAEQIFLETKHYLKNSDVLKELKKAPDTPLDLEPSFLSLSSPHLKITLQKQKIDKKELFVDVFLEYFSSKDEPLYTFHQIFCFKKEKLDMSETSFSN